MPMTVHDHGACAEMQESTDEPATVDKSGPDTLGQFLCLLRIFDDMMVQSHDPAGAGVLIGGNLAGAGLFR
jgi:hypothetical protein